MYDVKAWLKQHTEPMYNHSHPHIFRFRKGPDGHCYMQYKKWRQSEWEPQSERSRHGVRILKVLYNQIITNKCVKKNNVIPFDAVTAFWCTRSCDPQ